MKGPPLLILRPRLLSGRERDHLQHSGRIFAPIRLVFGLVPPPLDKRKPRGVPRGFCFTSASLLLLLPGATLLCIAPNPASS